MDDITSAIILCVIARRNGSGTIWMPKTTPSAPLLKKPWRR
jgi:hypothetical protein